MTKYNIWLKARTKISRIYWKKETNITENPQEGMEGCKILLYSIAMSHMKGNTEHTYVIKDKNSLRQRELVTNGKNTTWTTKCWQWGPTSKCTRERGREKMIGNYSKKKSLVQAKDWKTKHVYLENHVSNTTHRAI